MPKQISKQQKKQAVLYACNALSITAKRRFEQDLKTHPALKEYLDELKSTIQTTREIETLRASEELLQGNRNLLRNRIQIEASKQSNISKIVQNIKNVLPRIKSIVNVRQPIWAVATYVIIGLIAGRLLLSPNDDKTIDISGQNKVDMNKLIQSGLLSDIQINQSTLSPASVKLISDTDSRFNVSGNVNDQNIRQILYYLLLNDKNIDNRFEAGKLINRITPDNESRRVLIASVLSEKDQKVKLQSMKTLSQYQTSKDLMNACKRILIDDRNAEMRLEALSILGKNKSGDIIPLLEVVSEMDDDSIVRGRAKELLVELQKPVSIENNEESQ